MWRLAIWVSPSPPENLFLYPILHKLLRLKREIYRPGLLACSCLTVSFCLPELVNKASGLGRAPGCNTEKEVASQVPMSCVGCAAASLTAGFCFLVVILEVWFIFQTTAVQLWRSTVGSYEVENASKKEMKKLEEQVENGADKGDLLLCVRAFWGTGSLLTVVNIQGKKALFSVMVGACLFSVFQSLLWVRQPEGRPNPSFNRDCAQPPV